MIESVVTSQAQFTPCHEWKGKARMEKLCQAAGLKYGTIEKSFEKEEERNPGTYISCSTQPDVDVRYLQAVGNLNFHFPGLVVDRVVRLSRTSLPFFINSKGVPGYEKSIIMRGTQYNVPVGDIDTIVPLDMMEKGGERTLKGFNSDLRVVRRCLNGDITPVFCDYEGPEDLEFPISYEGPCDRIGRGTELMLGMCVVEGRVDFPYERKTIRLQPMEVGEGVIFSRDAESNRWFIMDVISTRRSLLLCYLAAYYAMEGSGPEIYYSVGSHLTITKRLKRFLKKTKLSHIPGVQYPQEMLPHDILKLNQYFSGCQFNFSQVYGEIYFIGEPIKDLVEMTSAITHMVDHGGAKVYYNTLIEKHATIDDMFRGVLQPDKVPMCIMDSGFDWGECSRLLASGEFFNKYGNSMKDLYGGRWTRIYGYLEDYGKIRTDCVVSTPMFSANVFLQNSVFKDFCVYNHPHLGLYFGMKKDIQDPMSNVLTGWKALDYDNKFCVTILKGQLVIADHAKRQKLFDGDYDSMEEEDRSNSKREDPPDLRMTHNGVSVYGGLCGSRWRRLAKQSVKYMECDKLIGWELIPCERSFCGRKARYKSNKILEKGPVVF